MPWRRSVLGLREQDEGVWAGEERGKVREADLHGDLADDPGGGPSVLHHFPLVKDFVTTQVDRQAKGNADWEAVEQSQGRRRPPPSAEACGSPPPPRAGSRSPGVGTRHCAWWKPGHRFQIKGLTNKRSGKSEHVRQAGRPPASAPLRPPALRSCLDGRLLCAHALRGGSGPSGSALGSRTQRLRALALQLPLEGPGRRLAPLLISTSRDEGA